MIKLHTFNKGQNKDTSNIYQPQDTVKSIQNFVQLNETDGLYSLTNEKGTSSITNLPDEFRVIGHTVLDRDVILVLAHPSGYSQVGVFDGTSYTRKVPSTDTGSELGFSIDKPVDCVARKLFTGDTVLYFTDNTQPFGSVNLDSPPEDSEISEITKLIPNVQSPNITYVRQLETGGDLYPGIYQFAVRYVSADNTKTTVFLPTNPIPVVDETRSSGGTNYDGADVEDGPINKSIELRITDLDENFPSFEVIAIRYEGITNTFSAYSLPELTVEGPTRTYIFTSLIDGVPITLEELRELGITYDRAKCIDQKDSRLILANLSESSADFDEELQTIANNITMSYDIEEELFVERDLNQSSGFTLVASNFTEDYIDLLFSSPAQPFMLPFINLYHNGAATIAEIQITDYTDLNTDTLTIEGDSSTHVYTFGVDIAVGVSNEDTAVNIFDVISAESDITDLYNVSLSGDTVILNTYDLTSTTYTLTYTNNAGASGISTTNTAGSAGVPIPLNTVITFPNTQYQYFRVAPTFSLTTSSSYQLDFNNLPSLDGSQTYNNVVELSTDSIQDEVDALLNPTPSSTTVANYKLEENTVYKKGYRRNETYSFALAVEFKNGSRSYGFHIPGNDKLETNAGKNPADTISKELGTYVSSFDYPIDQYYPGNLAGDDTSFGSTDRLVRHHVMPTIEQEPHFRYDNVTGDTYIRLMNVSMEFNSNMSQELKDAIQTIYLVRESRSNVNNRSVYAQGVPQHFIETYNTYENDDTGTPVADSNVLRKQPFFSEFELVGEEKNVLWDDQIVAGSKSVDVPSIAYQQDSIEKKIISLFSPELQFNFIEEEELPLSQAKRVMSFNGVASYSNSNVGLSTGWVKGEYNIKRKFVTLGSTKKFEATQNFPGSLWMFGNYYEPVTGPLTGQSQSITGAYKVDDLSSLTISSLSSPVSAEYGTGTYILEFDSDFNIYDTSRPSLKYSVDVTAVEKNNLDVFTDGSNVPSSDIQSENYTVTNDDTISWSGSGSINNIEFNSDLISIELPDSNSTQYGEMSLSEYILVSEFEDLDITIGKTFSDIYGGDTFINKVAMIDKDVLRFDPLYVKKEKKPPFFIPTNNLNPDVNPYGEDHYGSAATKRDPDHSKFGLDVRSIHYFFVESSVNCDYRHEFKDDDGDTQTRYYPKSIADDAMGTAFEKGLAISYNSQYSFENKVMTFFSKGKNERSEKDFSTRLIYSSESQEDSLVDNYRVFPQNNFQDIPRNTGEIWDLFIESDVVYAHTPKSLWKLYSDPKAITASSIGEVVLGTGNTYSLPADERTEIIGGYAGTISQFAGTHTPAGYIFPDALQGKVFSLSGGSLQEISKKGMINYFNNNLQLDYIDNPYTGDGILGAYDFTNKRYIISKKDSSAEDITQSFSFLSDSWVSGHSYNPDAMISFNNKLYFIGDQDVAEMNKGDYGSYFDTVYPSTINLISNDNPTVTKTFDNVYIKSNKYDLSGIIPYSTFDNIKVINDYNESDTLDIVVSSDLSPALGTTDTLCRFTNEEYKLPVPRDNSKASFKKRMKGKYLELELTLDNTDKEKFVLDYIKTVYRINQR